MWLSPVAQTGTEVELILDLVSRASVIGLLFFVIYGGWKRWWVFSWAFQDERARYEAMRDERDEWKEIALRSVNLAETVNELRQTRGRA